ncbi:dihydrodipicolinate synthase family protein [Arcticibacterium luteifluviistationis]|uniref:Dihydrodipicolinate synthase family protein n=1 Tax=Arcticibacterium luteifluviistationis TaxID=1784714 RepID=A0A2Z4G778_9BACT|nr:dihydrodipicolinate synthase family protein [Arcticibacterium luteifluviistationis]AWV97024.1 dihydrodipicolinate synthase family protein [Arcticibacterium luteifluviistationis]
MSDKLNSELSGIITPLVTPLKSDFSLDEEALAKIINHAIDGGVHAIFPLGTTGEFASFSLNFQLDLIKKVSKVVNGRVAVLISITSSCLDDSFKLAEMATTCHADAVVATLPFYFTLNQDEIVSYFQRIADGVKLPLYMYNMPGMTKIHIAPETVNILAKHPNIIGLKDSSGDMNYFKAVSELVDEPGFSLYVGPEEELAEALRLGAKGGVNGGSNIFPEFYVELFNAFEKGDLAQVEELQTKIKAFSAAVYNLTDNPNSYLQGLKAAMSVKGLCEPTLAPPLKSLGSADMERLRIVLNDWT